MTRDSAVDWGFPVLECPDKSLITPAIEKMAALLSQFAAQYDGPRAVDA